MALLLTLNAGSSSLKFGVYRKADEPDLIIAGQVERLGPDARMVIDGEDDRPLGMTDHTRALDEILTTVWDHIGGEAITGVGHRIAHGGTDFLGPTVLTEAVLVKLRLLAPLAPLHQPHNLTCVDAAIATFPDAVQMGCFDTSFHRGHPWVNDTFALPRRFYREGVRRYGFHGLSYDYITGVLAERHPNLTKGRLVVAHLGNGASICAIKEGKSLASTMGFSALDGLPMGTRSGQLDPGVLLYLMDQRGMSAAELTTLLYRESGILGLSGLTSDMRTLEASDAPEAAQAIDYYVFRLQREIGAMAASLGGIDGLVFTGGIGENSRLIRARATEALGFMGIAIDEAANRENREEIGTGDTRVLVIPTDEERVIARALCATPQAVS
ncbi:acetate/propionate family kinase [Litoreibacter roseus]|uniref:Acetate kinase n=1 Tax=Litoreibacter roseus TaxID=2601869 RepID=A0A6N6JHE8_9RHOB|nr:acetate/propionate family kinase [Litoreibacter roseus]GFE65260.1 acetate kinase [Litoreibacter roseus]